MYESQRSWDSEDEVMLPHEVEVDRFLLPAEGADLTARARPSGPHSQPKGRTS